VPVRYVLGSRANRTGRLGVGEQVDLSALEGHAVAMDGVSGIKSNGRSPTAAYLVGESGLLVSSSLLLIRYA